MIFKRKKREQTSNNYKVVDKIIPINVKTRKIIITYTDGTKRELAEKGTVGHFGVKYVNLITGELSLFSNNSLEKCIATDPGCTDPNPMGYFKPGNFLNIGDSYTNPDQIREIFMEDVVVSDEIVLLDSKEVVKIT